MASVPYMADFDYLKSYGILLDVNTDFTVLDFERDKKLAGIYFNNSEKLKNLISKVEEVRSQ